MISPKTLKTHYAEYTSRPEEWVQDRAKAKESIVQYVLDRVDFKPKTEAARVVVLGASDKRYISVHQNIFEKIIGRNVEVITFDIDVNHLEGEKNIVLHDVTLPFPDSPYDIVFSHSLMKFLTPEEQLAVIKNSHEALSENGFAMHIMHSSELEETERLKDWQYRVNLPELLEKVEQIGIPTPKVFVFNSETFMDWQRKTTILVTQKSFSGV